MKKQFLTMMTFSILLFNACSKDNDHPKLTGTAYLLDQNSKIEWRGKAADGKSNQGTIDVKGKTNADGFDFDVLNNEIKSGAFTIPISSINVTNLPPDRKPILENHLKSADFFYVALNPTVTFKIYSGKPEVHNGSTANYTIKGEMTLLGNNHPLDFPAQVTFTDKVLNIKANFSFNQTQWGMNYHIDQSYPENDRILAGIEVKFNLTAKIK